MTDERQEQKSPEEAGPEAAQPVGDRQDQGATGRFSKEPVGGADEDAERHEGPPRPQGETETKVGERFDEGKEDPQDSQEKGKLGEAQDKLGGRPLPAAVVAAVGMALLLLLLLRRRRG